MELLFYFVIIWAGLFLTNVFLLALSKDGQYDNIYVLGQYHYNDVKRRLILIEKLTGKKQSQLRRFLNILRRNHEVSGILNTKRYTRYIEPIVDKILISHYVNNWNYFWHNSGLVTKIQFFYMLLLPFWFFIASQLSFTEEEIPNEFIFALFPLIAVVIMFAVTMIIANIVCYYIVVSFLNLFKVESGILNKNIAALEAVTDSIKFYKNSVILLTVAGVLGIGNLGKASKFKGLGGGKFGGSGAGGSW